jgi:hypothetical protein
MTMYFDARLMLDGTRIRLDKNHLNIKAKQKSKSLSWANVLADFLGVPVSEKIER